MSQPGSSITNQEILDVASKTFRDAGQEIFERGRPGFFELFTEVIPTDSEQNEIDLLDAAPVVREWKGPKMFRAMRAHKHIISLTPKEVSFRLNFLKVRYDRTGLIGRRVNWFMSARGPGGQFYDKLATDKLIENPVGYDGVPIFDASHPFGPNGGVQSNITTSALSFANHNAIRVAGQSRQFENGEPMHTEFDVLMVGPANEQLGKEITQSTERILPVDESGSEATSSVVAAASVPNVFGGGDMMLVVNPRLVNAAANYCYYFDTNLGATPIVCYEGRAPEPQDKTEMDDQNRFLNNELWFSLEADQGYGAGFWQAAHAIIV